jgi:uncharacterized protein
MHHITTVAVISLFALTACAPPPDSTDERQPTIEVLGRAFVEQAPNRARFNVEFEEKNEDSAAASAAVVEHANRAAEAIRLASDGQVRITSNLNVRPYYRQVTRRLNEFNEQLVENVHPDALLGYVARVSVSVEVLDPGQAAAARGAALAAGPVQSSALGFYLEPTAEGQRAAYEAAVEDAQLRAELAAKAGGAVLGGLQLLQEGQGPCLGTAVTETGYRGRTVALARGAAEASAAPLPPRDASSQQLAAAAEQFALAADLQPQRIEGQVCAIYTLKAE